MVLFGHLRDTLTMNFEDLFEKHREMFPRPNVKISASVRAGTVMLNIFLLSSLNIFLCVQVLVQVGDLRPPDSAVLPERAGQVHPARVPRAQAGIRLSGEPVRVSSVL